MWHFKSNKGSHVTSKTVVYDWGHDRSIPRRILPITPPPPRWCWGPLDSVLKAEGFTTKSEGSVGTDTETVEEFEFDNEYGVEESSDTARIIEYNHGRKFLINPLFKKVDPDQKLESEDVPQLSGASSSITSPSPSPGVASLPDPEILSTEEFADGSIKGEEISGHSSSCSSGNQMSSYNGNDVKKEDKPSFMHKGIRCVKSQPRRKVPQKNGSDLDFIIGQKLSKCRVATSSRNYAKPPKIKNPVGEDGEESGSIKSMEEALTQMEEGSDEDQKESLSNVKDCFLKLRNDIFETGGT